MPTWLDNAIFYEIYPQSFYDTNGDGIGDIAGIIQKLDYIQDLGCNVLWIHPCFDSPFRDAGYDIRDYKKVAPRYGTNDNLKRLFNEAHSRNLRVILDLVPGHTSEEHPWFQKSKESSPNEYSNRYIWTDRWFKKPENFGYISGEADRDGAYIVNFFKCQPALNYGFLNVTEPWQLPMDHPDCIATKEALKDIIRFWLDSGCDGYRVDMAFSLVKNDDDHKTGTSSIWKEIRAMLDADYPEAALISEWGNPALAIPAGFHADFLLPFKSKGWMSLLRDDNCFFNRNGYGDITHFLDEYLPLYEKTKREGGYIALVTGNHDIERYRMNLSPEELALAWAFIFTMPGIPFLYYGDEIGMRYLNLPNKEGGYTRTGSRTPMQWSSGKNLGFSTAAAEQLYLPVDSEPDAPTVEALEKDLASLLNTVKTLLRLRKENSELQSMPNLEIVFAEKGKLPVVLKREKFLIAVNPSAKAAEIVIEAGPTEKVFAIGGCDLKGKATGSACGHTCRIDAQSFGIWKQISW